MITVTSSRVSGRNVFDFNLEDVDILDSSCVSLASDDSVKINFVETTTACDSFHSHLLLIVVDNIAKGVESSIVHDLNLQMFASVETSTNLSTP